MSKLISVIIPAYNGERYISEAISSVQEQQMNTEILVVDDGSDDKTAQIAQSTGVYLFHTKHQGAESARNIGIQKSRGDYILFLDCDDILVKGSLQRMYDFLEQNPDISYVHAKVKEFLSPDAHKRAVRSEPYTGILTGAFLFKKQFFKQIGMFDENLQAGGGIDLILRAKAAGIKSHELDIIATQRRIHDNNMGILNRSGEYKDYLTILRKQLLLKKTSKTIKKC